MGAKEILLRPTMQAVMSVETEVGGLGYLAFRFSQTRREDIPIAERYKYFPSMTEVAAIIYLCQAKPDELKRDEIFELVMARGISIIKDITAFITIMAAGDIGEVEEISEDEKKS